MQRFWRYATQLCTSEDLKLAGVSRLRCIDLGRCETRAEAEARGQKTKYDQPLVIARNVRIACDSGNGAKWGLTADQITRLRAGESISLHDAAGDIVIGYSRVT